MARNRLQQQLHELEFNQHDLASDYEESEDQIQTSSPNNKGSQIDVNDDPDDSDD